MLLQDTHRVFESSDHPPVQCSCRTHTGRCSSFLTLLCTILAQLRGSLRPTSSRWVRGHRCSSTAPDNVTFFKLVPGWAQVEFSRGPCRQVHHVSCVGTGASWICMHTDTHLHKAHVHTSIQSHARTHAHTHTHTRVPGCYIIIAHTHARACPQAHSCTCTHACVMFAVSPFIRSTSSKQSFGGCICESVESAFIYLTSSKQSFGGCICESVEGAFIYSTSSKESSSGCICESVVSTFIHSSHIHSLDIQVGPVCEPCEVPHSASKNSSYALHACCYMGLCTQDERKRTRRNSSCGA